MLHPDHMSSAFGENLEILKASGFRFPVRGELPSECEIEGPYTFLVNAQGDIKSVNQVNGEIEDWPYRAKAPRKLGSE